MPSSAFVNSNLYDRPKSLRTDVLIIGAGPSGLMAAQALGRLGVDVTVVERRAPGDTYGNADGLQPRTLEIWRGYEMVEKISAKGTLVVAMVGYEASKSSGCLVRSRPSRNVVASSRYPYEIAASILDIEAILRENADEAHVNFLHSSQPVSLSIDNSQRQDERFADEFPVTVTIESAFSAGKSGINQPLQKGSDLSQVDQNVEIISAKYVIGADGAHSWVRRALGITMEGDQTEDVWGVVDVIMQTDFPDFRFKCIIQSSTGPVIIIPREGEKVRIYIDMTAFNTITRREDGRLNKSTFDPSHMQQKILQRIQERLAPYTVEFTQVFWSTIFSTAQKVASKFSFKNRVFIAGDACHTHSPKAGQGANASMGDSHNLAWKLAYVLRGWAKSSILETYEDERRKYALELISFDKVISTSLEGGAAADYQRLLHKQNLFTSGTGISYASSKLTVQTGPSKADAQVVAGERFPSGPIIRLADWHLFDAQDLVPSDGKFKLILLPGDMLQTKANEALFSFARAFQSSIQTQFQGSVDGLRRRLAVYTIIRSSEEDICWKDIPSELVESWKCCFSVQDSSHKGSGLYEQFGMHGQADEGVLVLVRPDGYMSMIAGLFSPQISKTVVSYIREL